MATHGNSGRTDDFPHRPAASRVTVGDIQRSEVLEDIDDSLWWHLCSLIPEGDYESGVKAMLECVSPELRTYYLCRRFDWERGSGGLEECMMQAEDEYLILETIRAFEELGAVKHAEIIRELLPIAKARQVELLVAQEGEEDLCEAANPFEPYEARWEDASQQFDFNDAIFKKMKSQPHRFCPPGTDVSIVVSPS